MRRVVTRILWLAAAGVLLYGGFVAYERWWSGDSTLLKDRVFSFISGSTEEIKEQAVKAGSEALDGVKEQVTERAKGVVSSIIGGAIQSIGETIQNYGESVAGTTLTAVAPAATGPSFLAPPPPIALSARVGEKLSFAVNKGTRYTATWGDGKVGEGEKDADATVLLWHAWGAPGDYVMTLVTGGNGVSHMETFPVRVYAEQ